MAKKSTKQVEPSHPRYTSITCPKCGAVVIEWSEEKARERQERSIKIVLEHPDIKALLAEGFKLERRDQPDGSVKLSLISPDLWPIICDARERLA